MGTSLVADYMTSYVPFKYRWPEFPLAGDPANDYELIFDEEMKVRLRTPDRSKLKNAPMDITEAESGMMKLRREPADLGQLAHEVVELYQYVAEEKKPVIIVQVPLGILVSEAVALSVDGDQPQRIVIETCTPAGCFAGSVVPDALIAKMRTGKEIKIVFSNVARQPLTVTMPLSGFAVAYDKVKG